MLSGHLHALLEVSDYSAHPLCRCLCVLNGRSSFVYTHIYVRYNVCVCVRACVCGKCQADFSIPHFNVGGNLTIHLALQGICVSRAEMTFDKHKGGLSNVILSSDVNIFWFGCPKLSAKTVSS